MHIQVVEFSLKAMSESEFRSICDDLAPAFAAIPGLIAKTWLADAANNIYGGVYMWENAQAMVSFAGSELFAAVKADPHFGGLRSRDYGVIEGPTQVTRGMARALAS